MSPTHCSPPAPTSSGRPASPIGCPHTECSRYSRRRERGNRVAGPARSGRLPMAALALVERLVPCDTVSHNAIDLELGRATIHTTGPLPDADTIRVFAAHAAENPLVAYQDATGDPSPVRLSDFVTARQFRRRPIYNLVYRGLGMEFQLASGVGADPGQVVGICIEPGSSGFLRPRHRGPRAAAAVALADPRHGRRRRCAPGGRRATDTSAARDTGACGTGRDQYPDRQSPPDQREDGRKAPRARVRGFGRRQPDRGGGSVDVGAYVILRIEPGGRADFNS
jgi:hypothetical protein